MSNISKWNGDKRLQMQVLEIAKNTLALRSLDWDRDRFDIEFGLQEGTTYNAYLIFGESKTCLVDASHVKFREQFMNALTKELRSRGRRVDYLIASHTEPDHSGLIPDVLDKFPEAEVIGSRVCLQFLEQLTNRDSIQSRVVKNNDTLDLGGGHVLDFMMAPNLHWPDTMFSLDRATGVMYTCDAFGMHYCTEDPYDSDVSAAMPHFRFYYDCLMRPNARSVLTAQRKIKEWQYSTIAVGHGPILTYNVDTWYKRYAEWSQGMGKAEAMVAVLYSSEYGYSDRLSQTIARGITKSEVATEMVDLLSVDHAELRDIIGRATGIVVMCPSSESKEASESLSVVIASLDPKKKVFIAESYGEADEPVDTLTKQLIDGGVEPLFDGLRLKATPTERDYQLYEEAGTDLAQQIGQKASMVKKRAMDIDVAKALGKLSTGLYVVTAAHDDAKSAMIASWVQQASFQPLGITIAIAKDRAIEYFMQVNDRFVLNVLEEGNYQHVMKHFLQRFKPGADRFEGVDYVQAEACGAPVLKDALAYLECKVVQRMETADHWVAYCHVMDGDLQKGDPLTAVHRRKIGNYY